MATSAKIVGKDQSAKDLISILESAVPALVTDSTRVKELLGVINQEVASIKLTPPSNNSDFTFPLAYEDYYQGGDPNAETTRITFPTSDSAPPVASTGVNTIFGKWVINRDKNGDDPVDTFELLHNGAFTFSGCAHLLVIPYNQSVQKDVIGLRLILRHQRVVADDTFQKDYILASRKKQYSTSFDGYADALAALIDEDVSFSISLAGKKTDTFMFYLGVIRDKATSNYSTAENPPMVGLGCGNGNYGTGVVDNYDTNGPDRLYEANYFTVTRNGGTYDPGVVDIDLPS